MPEQTIINSTVVRLSEAQPTNNQYGDLLFTDNQGNEYKIGNKRSAFFSIIRANAGKEIKLGWAKFNGKDYIATVGVIAPTQPTTQKQANNPPQRVNPTAPTQNAPISGSEKGMIIKEIGDSFRCGMFNQEEQPGLWEYYKKEISRVTGVKIS